MWTFLRRFFCLAALLMVFFPMATRAGEALEEGVTVIVTVEGFTLGYGFLVEPTAVVVPAGSSVWDATVILFEQMGVDFVVAPWGGLERVLGLGMFDYGEESGWLFTVNHYMAQVGADELIAEDMDVVRWQFSVVGWGADLGISEARGFWTAPLVYHIDFTWSLRSPFRDMGPLTWSEEMFWAGVLRNLMERMEYQWNSIAAWQNPFVDITGADWFFAAVRHVNMRNWMVGVESNRFDPDGIATVAMVTTMLWRVEGEPFAETTGQRWYSQAVAWAGVTGDVHRPMYIRDFFELLGYYLYGSWSYDVVMTRAQAAYLLVW